MKQGQMKYEGNIVEDVMNNDFYRKVLASGRNCQILVMNILPNNEIGEENHKDADQIVLFVHGSGQIILNGEKNAVKQGDWYFIPAGTLHNIENTGKEDLKLATIYSPPIHSPYTFSRTREEAMMEPQYQTGRVINERQESPDVANWNIS